MRKRVFAFLTACVAFLTLLAGCGGRNALSEIISKNQALTLSPESTAVTTRDGITVEVGDYVLEGETELKVTKREDEENAEEGYKIESYDFDLGGLHELDDFITIRIPYDTGYCDEGQDPSRCVGAKYRNETSGEWEDVLFETDSETGELVIYTDHLSCYGVFYVKNEGKRGAYITDVLDSGFYMDSSTAIAFGKRIAADDPTVAEELAKFGIAAISKFYDYSDRLDNAISMATLGDVPDWLSVDIPNTNLTLFSAIGYLSTCHNLMKIAVDDTVGSGADKGEILNLVRDVGNKVTMYWADSFSSLGSGALSVGMGGVLIIDKMLTAFAEEAEATRLEDIQFIYHHYNEGYTGNGHKLMTSKDWRAKVIDVLERHPDDPEVAMEALENGFRKYASEFFKLSLEEMNEVAADTPGVTVKRVPNFTREEQEKLIDEYVSFLKDKTMPGVLTSVNNYMLRKAEQTQLSAVNAVKDYYNTRISITVKENIPDGGSSRYAGYIMRFAPLDETVDVRNWTGKWNETGVIKTYATLIGFATAGFPHTVELYAPDADINSDEPELVVPFVIGMPEIVIEIGGAPSFDEVVGSYPDGTITVAEVYASDSIRSELAEGGSDNELGCDIGELISSLEEQIGVPNEYPFSIEKTGENSGVLLLDEDTPGDVSYSPSSGVLTFTMSDEGITLSGELRASYNADKTAIVISGELKTTLGYDESDFCIRFRLEGSKGLAQ